MIGTKIRFNYFGKTKQGPPKEEVGCIIDCYLSFYNGASKRTYLVELLDRKTDAGILENEYVKIYYYQIIGRISGTLAQYKYK